MESLPILDVTALTDEQLESAAKIFDEMSKKSLRPMHEIDTDSVRKELDERFATEVLGLDDSFTAEGGPLELLRSKLAAEPSVLGGKSGDNDDDPDDDE